MSSTVSKSSRLTRDQNLIAGINKHLTGVSLIVSGQTLTTKQVVAVLQGEVDAIQATITAKANLQAAIQSERADLAASKVAVASIRKTISVMFGQNADTLADFGLTPAKKRTPLTVEQKNAAKAKAAATRAARHTMGKKQKAAVKGTVPVTDTVPQVQPVQPPEPPPKA